MLISWHDNCRRHIHVCVIVGNDAGIATNRVILDAIPRGIIEYSNSGTY